MTMSDLIQMVDKLSHEELRELRQYIEQREHEQPIGRGATPEERIRLMTEASAIIREDMTQAELDEMFAAMNEEYIEEVDEDIWRD